MRMRSTPLVFALVSALVISARPAAAQAVGRPLDHDDYDRWNRITGERLSPDGRWLAYAVVPGEGDAQVMVRDIDAGTTLTIQLAQGPVFSGDSRWLVSTQRPPFALVDSLKRAKAKDDEMPGDSVVIVDLARVLGGAAIDRSGISRMGRIRSFRLAEAGALLAVHFEADDGDDDEEPTAETPEEPESDEGDEARDRGKTGTPLVLRDLASGREDRFEHVTDYRFTDDGRYLFLTRTTPDGPGDGVVRVDTRSGDALAVVEGAGRYTRLALQEDGHRAVFLTDRDATDDHAGTMAVYVADDAGVGRRVAAGGDVGLPEGWSVSSHSNPSLSPDGARVFFGSRPAPIGTDPELEDLLPDEQVKVDIWSWNDDRLQPMQLVELEDDTTQAYLSWVPFGGGTIVPLATLDVPTVRLVDDGAGDVALGLSDLPYRKLVSWDARYSDAYLIDLPSGRTTQVAERLRGSAQLSPEGRWIYWWDGDRRGWFARATSGGDEIALTAGIPYPVHDELDDHPDAAPSYGNAGWASGDGAFIVYDRNDIWMVDPTSPRPPRSLTEGVGRRDGLRFRVVDLDPESDAVPMSESVILTAFHLTTKQSGLYRDRFDGGEAPRRIVLEDARISAPTRADDADRFVFTRETFREFPDLWVSGPDFSDAEKVSNANPQQDEVRWGTAELVEWTSNDGIPLQGILYKPDGFDASRTWPMMVYFYERSSDGLHRYVTPAAGGSSINYSFYVSRGYLLFVPDIPYEIGHPGESALDAVIPGVQLLANRGFVDRARIGVQGHSWGGYQIAWMITRTNLFAAAEAGAPVANMTSAYGGIRWGTGMSRMFQYERTQSRIGGSLWEAPLLYIENSPLFSLDKVQTPLLMMHNDEDTAVPWEQGIELFVALRRLDKPVWLLNYNGEAHGLGRTANRKDWAIRMQQFFDHYLKDAPAPRWMDEGVPAILKGRTLGLDTKGGRRISDPDAGG